MLYVLIEIAYKRIWFIEWKDEVIPFICAQAVDCPRDAIQWEYGSLIWQSSPTAS